MADWVNALGELREQNEQERERRQSIMWTNTSFLNQLSSTLRKKPEDHRIVQESRRLSEILAEEPDSVYENEGPQRRLSAGKLRWNQVIYHPL